MRIWGHGNPMRNGDSPFLFKGDITEEPWVSISDHTQL